MWTSFSSPPASMSALTFAGFHLRWPDADGPMLRVAFDALPQADQDAAWTELCERERLRIGSEVEYDRRAVEPWCSTCRSHEHDGPPWATCSSQSTSPPCRRPRVPVAPGRSCSTSRPARSVTNGSSGCSIPAEEYVERLTGQHVGASRKVHCPLHEERSASFHVYPDHWHCFGCHEGRDLFDLASALLSIPARGPDWPILVDALTEVFR